MFTSIGPENALKKIQYPFLIKNQNNTTKMAIVRNVLNMKKKHVYVKTPKPERIAITKTCPDLTTNNSKQRLQMGGLEPQHLHEIGNLIKL